MNRERLELEFTEPERYELHEGPYYQFAWNRREFVQVLGAGLLLSVSGPTLHAQRAGRQREAGPAERLHLGEDGTITVLTGKVEVGQGSRTEIAQAAAEELGVPLSQLRVIMADSEVVPDDGGSAGSRTTPSTIPAVRKACAMARQMLLERAAEQFQVALSALSVRQGRVEGLPAETTFGYAHWAKADAESGLKRELKSEASITRVERWRVLGTAVTHLNGRDMVTGRHQYPSDVRRPGMLYGVVMRPPSLAAKLLRVDLEPARQSERVFAVRDGEFVGVAAPTTLAAAMARDAVAKTAEWSQEPHPSSEELEEYLRKHADLGRARRNDRGNLKEALEGAEHAPRATYRVAYIQHAPMEPRAAVAEWKEGQLTVWTGTQQPSRVREELARAFRVPNEKVRLIVPDTGGGFGGKHSGEAALEAARLAKAAERPVQVRWTREEEFTWAYFRPAGLMDMAGGLNAKGDLVAWEHVNFNSGASALDTPYDVPNASTSFVPCDQPLRSGSYRALASTANAFARESFMDELAAAAGVDPLEFRLRHLSHDRLRAVLTAAAEHFGWASRKRAGAVPRSVGYGLACGTEKGSFVATCAEVGVDPQAGTYKVRRVSVAFECGAILNTVNLRAQVEGCVIQGLGAVLREEIRFKDGAILNPRFSRYQVPRFKDVPVIETVLLNRPDLSSVGAGETPIIGIAPAVGNAIYDATGARLRTLPLRNEAYRAET